MKRASLVQREWRKRNPDKLQAQRVRYRTKNLETIRARQWLRNYGVSAEQYRALWIAQQGECYLCGSKTGWTGRLLGVDHNHETGEVRALLCNRCNRQLAYYEDKAFMGSALRYLEVFA